MSRIAAERRPAAVPFVLPAVGTGPGNGHGAIARQTLSEPADVDGARALASGLLACAAAIQALAAHGSQPSQTSQKSEKPLFLTIPEAAAIAGLSRAYVRRAVEAGTLKAIRDGRRWRIRRTDLEAL